MSESKPLVFGCRPSGGIPDFLRLIIAALKQSGTGDLKVQVAQIPLTSDHQGVSVPLIFNNITRRSDVEKIRGRVERGARILIAVVYVLQGASLPLDKLDPNLMADLLKLYLLELPEPLVPYENYDKLLGSRSEGAYRYGCLVLIPFFFLQRLPSPKSSGRSPLSRKQTWYSEKMCIP